MNKIKLLLQMTNVYIFWDEVFFFETQLGKKY